MKRHELVRKLAEAGCRLKRHGSRHDLFENPTNGRIAPVPRHQEVKDSLCRLILRQLGIE